MRERSCIKKILVSPGDERGIGAEIVIKSLHALHINKNNKLKSRIFCFLNPSILRDDPYVRRWGSSILRQFPSQDGQDFLNNFKSSTFDPPPISIVWTSLSQKDRVITLSKICKESNLDCGLVTGPMRKIQKGRKVLGHTEILSEVSGIPKENLHMCFIGKYFSVVTLTGHIPIEMITLKASKLEWKRVLSKLYDLKKILHLEGPIGILGLNPHAGEGGAIGCFEQKTQKKIEGALNQLKFLSPSYKKKLFRYFISPDTAFIQPIPYKLLVGFYHDQVLTPFKTVHGFSGIQMTLGLPWIRTSVDHGTAEDIWGLNQANHISMMQAIEVADLLLHKKPILKKSVSYSS